MTPERLTKGWMIEGTWQNVIAEIEQEKQAAYRRGAVDALKEAAYLNSKRVGWRTREDVSEWLHVLAADPDALFAGGESR